MEACQTHLWEEASLARCNLIVVHLVQEGHCNYLVQHPVDEEDTQLFPSYAMDAVVLPEDNHLCVDAREVVVVVRLMNLFYLVNGVLILGLMVREVHSVQLYCL